VTNKDNLVIAVTQRTSKARSNPATHALAGYIYFCTEEKRGQITQGGTLERVSDVRGSRFSRRLGFVRFARRLEGGSSVLKGRGDARGKRP